MFTRYVCKGSHLFVLKGNARIYWISNVPPFPANGKPSVARFQRVSVIRFHAEAFGSKTSTLSLSALLSEVVLICRTLKFTFRAEEATPRQKKKYTDTHIRVCVSIPSCVLAPNGMKIEKTKNKNHTTV